MKTTHHLTGGPAFPGGTVHLRTGVDATTPLYEGMTLRDWFAGKALGRLAEAGRADDVARACYAQADAMLRAREGR